MLYYPLQVYHLACLNFRIYAKFLFILSYAASHDGMTFIEELRLEDAVQQQGGFYNEWLCECFP